VSTLPSKSSSSSTQNNTSITTQVVPNDADTDIDSIQQSISKLNVMDSGRSNIQSSDKTAIKTIAAIKEEEKSDGLLSETVPPSTEKLDS
jgi:translation elongation factor EF-1beta